MKFHKFRDLAKQHPWIIDIVDPLGYMRHDVQNMCTVDSVNKLRDHVRRNLESITFCHWRREMMEAVIGYYEMTMSFEYLAHCDPYYGGNDNSNYEVDTQIVWRVGDMPYAPTPHQDGMTLTYDILEIEKGYQSKMFGDGELDIRFIVERTTVDSKTRIKIYELPALNVVLNRPLPRLQPTPMSAYEKLQREAYMSGGDMPPLIPSPIPSFGQ